MGPDAPLPDVWPARADVCFSHGDEWKKPQPERRVHRMTEHELRAGVNEFTEDDPPPYGAPR